MTQIKLLDEIDHEGCENVTISARGHAGFNPGNDVVCAAISAILYAYINTIEAVQLMEEDPENKIRKTVLSFEHTEADEGGYIETHARLKHAGIAAGAVLTCMIGLHMIAERYEDNVKFTEDINETAAIQHLSV